MPFMLDIGCKYQTTVNSGYSEHGYNGFNVIMDTFSCPNTLSSLIMSTQCTVHVQRNLVTMYCKQCPMVFALTRVYCIVNKNVNNSFKIRISPAFHAFVIFELKLTNV